MHKFTLKLLSVKPVWVVIVFVACGMLFKPALHFMMGDNYLGSLKGDRRILADAFIEYCLEAVHTEPNQYKCDVFKKKFFNELNESPEDAVAQAYQQTWTKHTESPTAVQALAGMTAEAGRKIGEQIKAGIAAKQTDDDQ